jgi:hypothetical protein
VAAGVAEGAGVKLAVGARVGVAEAGSDGLTDGGRVTLPADTNVDAVAGKVGKAITSAGTGGAHAAAISARAANPSSKNTCQPKFRAVNLARHLIGR